MGETYFTEIVTGEQRMFGRHKHEWHRIDNKYYQEDKKYGNQGFVKTNYYHIEQCAFCGEKRKAIYNWWIHKPENDPDPDDKFTPDHGIMMRITKR